ncbi:uncharacterized protein LOC126267704 [Schistocerca gregaria]|uniref:uncharacterized protein LOC126267704 n=1 Tax=Schistocerca gregaria TaxID=7010 RepID=UPI00211E456E|nr:uncharacterized protein LOC126267704 [Schistocerca gregaria]
MIETFRFPEKHTALNISEALDNVISKWNIENKVVNTTTDIAGNMTAAVQLIHSGNIDMQHVPCLAHTINLVVKSSLISNTELCIMREKDLMKKPVHKLIQETETRWNSVENPTADEWRILSECLCVLEPFEVITSEISTEDVCNGKWATTTAQELQQRLQNSLIARLCLIETNKVHAVTTVLDPRFKTLPFTNPIHSKHAVANLITECTNLVETVRSTHSTANDTSHEYHVVQNASSSLWTSFDEEVSNKNLMESGCDSKDLEVQRYLEEPYYNARIILYTTGKKK